MDDDEEIDMVVEAVAMAIRQTCCDRRRFGKDWDKLPRRLREDYRAEARAAIAAHNRVLPDVPY